MKISIKKWIKNLQIAAPNSHFLTPFAPKMTLLPKNGKLSTPFYDLDGV